MLIISSSRVKIDRILPLVIKGSWAFSCFLFLIFMVMSLDLFKKDSHPSIETVLLPKPFSISFEKIGQGALSLHSMKKKSVLPDLSQEVMLLAKNIRPGRDGKEASFLLSLRSSQLERQVKQGETVFLSCDPSAGNVALLYRFSDRKTPLWIRPSFLERNKILLEVGLFMPSKETEAFVEEKAQFILQEDPCDWSDKFPHAPWLESLKQSKFWGQDLFLAKYGGEAYTDVKHKLKLEILGQKRSSFYFTSVGDFLAWEGENWVPIVRAEEAQNKPLAHIKSVSPRNIEIEAWDEEGFYPQLIKLDVQNAHRISSIKSEQLPQAARMRTTSQISCSLGRRRCLLKQGDWVLKTARGWRVLKRSFDLEEYLHHRLRGELYIFDSLVREQGKLLMKGVWLDEMRTQMHSFAVPVAGDQQAKFLARKEKKSSVLQKSRGTSITYLPSPMNQRPSFSSGGSLE